MKKKGISLIVLVITIIVIVILATAVIVTFVQNNPIENAKGATKKWNEKVLQEQADLFELDLLTEFQKQGLGSMVLPDHVKETYKNALKEGKTEEEARTIAKDSFIGQPDKWWVREVGYGDSMDVRMTEETLERTPLRKEIERVRDLLWKDDDGIIDLNIDESIVPNDLVNCIKAEQNMWIEYAKGNVTDDEFDAFDISNEPLYSFLEGIPTGKYYEESKRVLKVPFYFYKDENRKEIFGANDLVYGLYQSSFKGEIMIIDDNYTRIDDGQYSMPKPTKDTKVKLSKNLKFIGYNAFQDWVITKLVIPSSVEVIEKGAFGYNRQGSTSKLTELVIKKEKGSIPGEPWGLDTTKTTIKWEPEE